MVHLHLKDITLTGDPFDLDLLQRLPPEALEPAGKIAEATLQYGLGQEIGNA